MANVEQTLSSKKNDKISATLQGLCGLGACVFARYLASGNRETVAKGHSHVGFRFMVIHLLRWVFETDCRYRN